MTKITNISQVTPKFVLLARLSGGLSLVISLCYILLSITYFIFRYNCSAGSATSKDGAKYFWQTIFRVYVLSGQCSQRLTISKLTDESTILILVSVALAIAVALVVVATLLIAIKQNEGLVLYIDLIVYTYVGCFVSALVIDITTASFFGLDYNYLSTLLKELTPGSPANYKLEVIRQGVFWLMTISLKGYIAYVINGIFVILLIMYIFELKNCASTEHSIHNLGALSAFDRPQTKNTLPEVNTASPSSHHSSRRLDPHGYAHKAGRPFDWSESWHNSPKSSTINNARPFTYLEDVRQHVQQTMPSPVSYKTKLGGRDNIWLQPGPPVPVPDYSPEQPRKQKHLPPGSPAS